MRQPVSLYFRVGQKMAARFAAKVLRRINRQLSFTPKPIDYQRQNRPAIDANTFKTAFQGLGIVAGDSVLVHSGISNLGKIVGGPKAIFELIQDSVGIHGNALYPVFPFGGLMYAYLNSNPIFDVNTSPTKMGALSEYALNHQAMGQRSIHPTHSVLAFGDQSQFLLGDHHLCETAFADKSPFARLVEMSGKILLIGVGLNSVTSFHRVEDRLGGEFPVNVYKDEPFYVNCLDKYGQAFNVKTLAHNPFVSQVRDCNLVRNIFLDKGILKEVPVGAGHIAVIDARLMDECLEDLCRNHAFTIYGKLWGYNKQ